MERTFPQCTSFRGVCSLSWFKSLAVRIVSVPVRRAAAATALPLSLALPPATKRVSLILHSSESRCPHLQQHRLQLKANRRKECKPTKACGRHTAEHSRAFHTLRSCSVAASNTSDGASLLTLYLVTRPSIPSPLWESQNELHFVFAPYANWRCPPRPLLLPTSQCKSQCQKPANKRQRRGGTQNDTYVVYPNGEPPSPPSALIALARRKRRPKKQMKHVAGCIDIAQRPENGGMVHY